MPRFDEETIRKAKEWDLLSYLQKYEPEELVHLQGNNYTTRTHDSLKISNGKWYWFSKNIGGYTALDYLIKVKGMSFVDAVNLLSGSDVGVNRQYRSSKDKKIKTLLLPELDSNYDRVKAYLMSRGIDEEIIDYCIQNKLLFQTKDYGNALFVGYDSAGRPRYGALRSTIAGYKGELSGSDKHYSFSLIYNPEFESVHVFESAIDLLSYVTMQQFRDEDWKSDAYLSLAGVYAPKRSGVVPVALQRFLKENPQIQTVFLHLDNDEVGRAATAGIIMGLKEDYFVIDEAPNEGKDVNEELMLLRRKLSEEHNNEQSRSAEKEER